MTMNKDGITDHIRAQEDEYFRKKDRELVEMLRQADADARARRALEHETGLHDPAMLRELDLLGFTPDTIALLPLVPVLQVAWAKAGVSNAERAMIVNYSMLDPETGEHEYESFVLFQIDNLIVDTGFFTSIPEGAPTPQATPAGAAGSRRVPESCSA